MLIEAEVDEGRLVHVWIKAWIKLQTKTIIPIINFMPNSTFVFTVLECNINCLECQCVMYVLFYSKNKHYCHCSQAPALQQYNGRVRSWRLSCSSLWTYNSRFKYCHSGLPSNTIFHFHDKPLMNHPFPHIRKMWFLLQPLFGLITIWCLKLVLNCVLWSGNYLL